MRVTVWQRLILQIHLGGHDVDVCINQPGHDILTFEVDDLTSEVTRRAAHVAHLFNDVLVNQNELTAANIVVFAIKNMGAD